MKKATVWMMAIISIVLLSGSILSFLYPFLLNKKEGEITVIKSSPVGIKIDSLWESDELRIDYASDEWVAVFLVTEESANKFRGPSMEKPSLPEPLCVGKKGTFEIIIDHKGDYEILFLPIVSIPDQSFRELDIEENGLREVKVNYKMERSIRRETIGFLIYGSSLFVLSAGTGLIGYIGWKHQKEPDLNT